MAVLLSVWLMRQEIRFYETATLTKSILAIAQATEGASVKDATQSFRSFFESLYPHMAGMKSQQDEDLKAAMDREVQKGLISFSPVSTGPLRKYGSKMQLAPDYKARVQELRRRAPLKK